MAHTHEYDCIVCGAHFEDSKTLARHNQQSHLSTATGMERPRQDGSVAREISTGGSVDPAVDEAYAHDRNPRQGFEDPRSDSSKRT